MGKRYLFFFTLFFAAGLVGINIIESAENLKIAVCLIICLALLFGIFSHRILTAIFCSIGIILGILFYSFYTHWIVEPLYDLENITFLITAEVCDYPEIYEDSQRVEVIVDAEASGIGYIKSGFHTLIYLPLTEERLSPGDEIRVTSKFYIPTYSEGFDRKSYQASQGFFIMASSTGIENEFIFEIEECTKTPLRYWPVVLANQWKNQIKTVFESRISGFLISLLLGDRSEIYEEDYQNLKKSGLSHITAVSGMHLMILVAFLTRILGKRLGTFLSVPVVFFFAFMAGNTPSVMRAGIMVIAAAIAFLCMDETDSLTILALSLLILLLHNPYSIMSTSLQLSYLSTLGLKLYSANIQNFLERPFSNLPEKIKKLISVFSAAVSCSSCAMLFTAPILLFTFGYVSLIAPLANLLVISVVSLVFIGTLSICILPPLKFILFPLISVCSEYILRAADFSSDFWWLILDWNDSFAKVAVICACALVLIVIANRYTKPRFTLPILCVILIIAIQKNASVVQNRTIITVHAVGNGQMITVASGRDSLSLIDCGSGTNRDAAEILNEYMLWNSYDSIDTMILTAVDKAHARALEAILENVPIEQIVLPNNLQNNEFTTNALCLISQSGVACEHWTGEGESSFELSGTVCSLIGGIDRKLGVRLQTDSGDLLIMHSFTQKMMDSLLRQTPLDTDLLLLSTSNIEQIDLLEVALEITTPSEVIFSSGGDYVASNLYGIPTRNTYLEGNMTFHFTGKME